MDIDAKKPEGNAYAIMGVVSNLLKECGRKDEIETIMSEMVSGDYNNLCDVAERVTYGSIKIVNRS